MFLQTYILKSSELFKRVSIKRSKLNCPISNESWSACIIKNEFLKLLYGPHELGIILVLLHSLKEIYRLGCSTFHSGNKGKKYYKWLD
jgi:hypothetical protein